MASYIKKGETILIPFRNGQSICDSQLKPRIYKTREAFLKHFPGHYLGKNGVELVEYAEVVRCKNCKHTRKKNDLEQFMYNENVCICTKKDIWGTTKDEPVWEDGFCSYGERRTDGR